MRIWAKIILDQHIMDQTVREFTSLRSFSDSELETVIHELCQEMDLSRPILLRKHFREFQQFQRIVFKSADFMEPIDFDSFEVELIKEKKKS